MQMFSFSSNIFFFFLEKVNSGSSGRSDMKTVYSIIWIGRDLAFDLNHYQISDCEEIVLHFLTNWVKQTLSGL